MKRPKLLGGSGVNVPFLMPCAWAGLDPRVIQVGGVQRVFSLVLRFGGPRPLDLHCCLLHRFSKRFGRQRVSGHLLCDTGGQRFECMWFYNPTTHQNRRLCWKLG